VARSANFDEILAALQQVCRVSFHTEWLAAPSASLGKRLPYRKADHDGLPK